MTDPSIDPLERALAGLTRPDAAQPALWRAALARTPNPATRSYLCAPVLAASGVSLAVLITLVTLQPFPGPWTPAGGSLAAATGPAMSPTGARDEAARSLDRDSQLADDSRQRAQKPELAEGRLGQSTPAPAASAKQAAVPAPAEGKKDAPSRPAAAERTDALAREQPAPQPATTSAGVANNEIADSAFAAREELATGAPGAAPAQPSAQPASAPAAPPTPPSLIAPALPRTIGVSGWFYSAAVAGIPLWIALLVITILRRRASARAAESARPEPPPTV